jgi:hypothetical protein
LTSAQFISGRTRVLLELCFNHVGDRTGTVVEGLADRVAASFCGTRSVAEFNVTFVVADGVTVAAAASLEALAADTGATIGKANAAIVAVRAPPFSCA